MAGVTAGLLGIAHPHALAHLRTLQALPEVERIVLWDQDDRALSAARQATDHKIARHDTDLDALLRQGEPHFVLVCVPTNEAPAICLRALRAGAHVLAEKPIGRSAAEVEQVVAAAEQARLQLGVCYQNRYHPVMREARAIVGQGLIGPLVAVEIRLLTTQVRFRDPASWLFQRQLAGGGVLAWLGCHDLDLMRYITQDEIVSVSAEVATRSGEAIDVEDVAVLALRFRSGALGSLHIAYTLALHGGGYHNLAGYDTHTCFHGRAGRVTWSHGDARLHVESTDRSWAAAPTRDLSFTLPTSSSYGGVHGEAFVRDFIRSTYTGDPPPAAGRDALQVARIIDAAYTSSQSGRRVDVAPPER
ncbi:MAG TPA: Gfo/Idh/MocA family oxidoreductase [Roseiflexaceae bacterium]|nr:Gfo/Idh/MocA family oxidoreductase [Roseiflexaceae bacterium]